MAQEEEKTQQVDEALSISFYCKNFIYSSRYFQGSRFPFCYPCNIIAGTLVKEIVENFYNSCVGNFIMIINSSKGAAFSCFFPLLRSPA